MAKPYFLFLQELAEHNNKDWMDANRNQFLEVRSEFLEDVGFILDQLTEWEPEMIPLQPKDCVFRQNRDIRFSPNKSPYKTNLAAYFSVGGKKSNGPGYYLHLQPGGSFVAGGIWMPTGEILKLIRKEIDYSGGELENILLDPVFKDKFPALGGEKLKTSPRDYDADHPYIDFLKHKSFIVTAPIPDQLVESGNYTSMVVDLFRLMKPFHDFLLRAMDNSGNGLGNV